jgi:phage protein D
MASSRATKVYGEDPYTSPSITDSDIVTAVIGEAGCTAGQVDATDTQHKYVFQRNESHYNFCKRLASRNGYLLRANEGKIDFVKAQFDGGTELTPEHLMALDYTLSPHQVPNNLTVYGWDYVAKEKVEGTAAAGDIIKLGGGEDVVGKNGGIWAGDSYISDVLVTSQGGAKAMAVGELNRLARRFVRGRAVVQGDGALTAGTIVTFTGLSPKFNPEVLVVSARHIVEPTRGSTTEIQFCGNTWPT